MQAKQSAPTPPDLVGKRVRARNGKKLGRIIHCFEESFTMERGFFAPEDFTATYDAILSVSGDEVVLRCNKEDLERAAPPEAWIDGEAPPGNTMILDLEGGQRRADG